MPDRRESSFKVDRNTETLEVLAGERPKAIKQAALRLGDLDGLLALVPQLQSKKSVAAPTKAEFDALVADVQAIFLRLTAMRQALQARQPPS
jgi:hypothetical protein